MNTFVYRSLFFLLVGSNSLISAAPNANTYAPPDYKPTPVVEYGTTTCSKSSYYTPPSDYSTPSSSSTPYYVPSPTPDYYTPSSSSSTPNYYTPPSDYYTFSSSSSSSDYYVPSPTPDYYTSSSSSDYYTPYEYTSKTTDYYTPYDNTSKTTDYYVTPTPIYNKPGHDTPSKYPGCSSSICYDYVDKCGQWYGGCTLAPECGGPASPTWSTPYCSTNHCVPTTTTTTYTATYTTTCKETTTTTTTTTDYVTVTDYPHYGKKKSY